MELSIRSFNGRRWEKNPRRFAELNQINDGIIHHKQWAAGAGHGSPHTGPPGKESMTNAIRHMVFNVLMQMTEMS